MKKMFNLQSFDNRRIIVDSFSHNRLSQSLAVELVNNIAAPGNNFRRVIRPEWFEKAPVRVVPVIRVPVLESPGAGIDCRQGRRWRRQIWSHRRRHWHVWQPDRRRRGRKLRVRRHLSKFTLFFLLFFLFTLVGMFVAYLLTEPAKKKDVKIRKKLFINREKKWEL